MKGEGDEAQVISDFSPRGSNNDISAALTGKRLQLCNNRGGATMPGLLECHSSLHRKDGCDVDNPG